MTIQWFRAQEREGMIGFLLAAIEDGTWRAPRDWEGESDAMLSHFCLMVYERIKRGVPAKPNPAPEPETAGIAPDPSYREKTGSWW